MRKLTEYEALRAQNEVFLYLWERVYRSYIKKIKYDMADENYDNAKEVFDFYEKRGNSFAADLLDIDSDVGESLLREILIPDEGTWEDGYEFWREKIDEMIAM